MAEKAIVRSASQLRLRDTGKLELTFRSRDRKLIKSAHSFTCSKLDRLLSTIPANFLYLASLANKLVAAALPTLRLCSGVVRPLVADLTSSE